MASLFVKDLTSLDFSYVDAREGLAGYSLIADVVLTGELNQQSFVMDFGRVKKQVKALLDKALDHKLVIPEKTSELARGYDEGSGGKSAKAGEGGGGETPGEASGHAKPERIRLKLPCRGGILEYHAPRAAVSFVPGSRVDIPALETHCQKLLKEQLPANVSEVRVRLREEQGAGYFFHYSHGLKKHEGHCQRLAHGHRSTLAIWENGERTDQLEKEWSERWDYKFLGTREDLVAQKDGKMSKDHYAFLTHSSEGPFFMSLPRACCELVPVDTTIECLADYIARSLKERNPKSDFRVEAYEGVGKGAVATA